MYGYVNFSRGNGAFGWMSTPADMLRFVNAVDSLSTMPDLLSPATIKKTMTVTPASVGFGGMQFGCGWMIEGGERFWWGSLPGTFAMLYSNSNGIINLIAFNNSISWQDTDQFKY